LADLGLLEIALGRQAEQRLRHLGLARADGQRNVDRRERLARAREPLELVVQLLSIDPRPGFTTTAEGAAPARNASFQAHARLIPPKEAESRGVKKCLESQLEPGSEPIDERR